MRAAQKPPCLVPKSSVLHSVTHSRAHSLGRSFGNFAAPPFPSLFLRFSSAKADRKKCLLAGEQWTPRLARMALARHGQKREAAKLRTANGIKQRGGNGKRMRGRQGSDTTQLVLPLPLPVVRLLPFPFLTVGRSIGSRERCTRNWPRPQTATYRASSLTGGVHCAHANSRFFPSSGRRRGTRE